MASGSRQGKRSDGGQILRHLVRSLRSDLNLLSNEARKRHPAVREAAERGAMRLKSLSESKEFSLKVLAETDDVIHPLLFACETRDPRIVQISLASLQRLVQFRAIPQKSVESTLATLKVLMDVGVEELKVLQTILLLVTATDVIHGKSLAKALVLCFILYSSRDPSVHNTAGAAIRQIVYAVFERMNTAMSEDGKPDDHQELPPQARDAYLLFQDICFLTNGDPPAWLVTSLELELSLGLELLETVLRNHPRYFIQEKLFNQLLTERVCPLVIKLFSPTSKYRHSSPTAGAILAADKPTFSLSIRLLRILNVLIMEFYSCLITQCEIFLSMLVKFLDSDKPLWQRTLAVEVLYSFCNQPLLLKSFCESYDMQEHSSKIFCDIIDALGGFIQSTSAITSPVVQLPFGITSSPSLSTSGSSSSLGQASHSAPVGGARHVHLFSFRSVSMQVDALSTNKPVFLEMLDKTEVPQIPEGYPLVVAMNALLDAVRSVSVIVNGAKATPASLTSHPDIIQSLPSPDASGGVKEVMLRSSWSGVLAALALLLDACSDERTTKMILDAHGSFIQLCGKVGMTAPRDAFLTSLCKACLPPKYAMSFVGQKITAGTSGKSEDITSRSKTKTGVSSNSHSSQADPPAVRPVDLGAGRTPQEGAGGVRGNEGGGVGKSGTPTLIRSGGGHTAMQQSSVVTVKNLQCIDTLLQTIDHHGDILDTAWSLILTTVQHIVHLFGCKPAAAGSVQLGRVTESSSLALVSVEKKAEVVEVTDKLANLFRTTKRLSDRSLLHLINALCQLSAAAMQSAPSGGSSLFPLSSLLETGTSNLGRVKVVWEPITSHLIQVCSRGKPSFRQFGADAISSLIRGGLERNTQEELRPLLLSPLNQLTAVEHSDVRQKQLECVSNILHSSGQSLGPSWSIILEVICSATAAQSSSEVLVRAGFQSLQLVVADFLPAIPPFCLPVAVEVVGRYGLQTLDLNISLTSIGLLWNIADYLYQNRTTLKDSLEALRTETGQTGLTTGQKADDSLVSSFIKGVRNSSLLVFSSVWMLLFRHLSELCVDQERAAVRKSASQTLFSTISAHGGLLEKEAWQAVLWQVLFPLLERVNQAVGSASTSSLQTSLLIHHSRDTARKQWAETQVLALSGVARLFQMRWHTLCTLDGFERAWATFLEDIKTCAASSNREVSIAAMKSFLTIVDTSNSSSSPSQLSPHSSSPDLRQRSPSPETTISTVLAIQKEREHAGGASSLGVPPHEPSALSPDQSQVVWSKAWQALQSIGVEGVCSKLPSEEAVKAVLKHRQQSEEVDAFCSSVPSQVFLVHFLRIFPIVFSKLKPNFSRTDFQSVARVFRVSFLMPVTRDVSPFLVPSSNENIMSAVHRLILKCLGAVFTEEPVFQGEGKQRGGRDGRVTEMSLLLDKTAEIRDLEADVQIETHPQLVSLYPFVIDELLKCTSLAFNPPELLRIPCRGPEVLGKAPAVLMGVNPVPFGLGAVTVAVQLYRACVREQVELTKEIPLKFLKTLHIPLGLKHRCPHPSMWTKSVEALLLFLRTCVPSMLKEGDVNPPFWSELASILEDFLFNPIPGGMEVSAEKMREYEALDIKVIELVKSEILPCSTHAPKEFLRRLTSVLNRGSIHSATDQFDGDGAASQTPFRENFARVCFQALLQFSFVHSQGANIDATSQLALNALLQRCEEVLLKFVSDERLSGACPLPRSRMNEVALVLKSVTVLISTLREAQKSSSAQVDRTIWQNVGRLYPALVQCVTCSSLEVRTALKEALSQFSDLVNP